MEESTHSSLQFLDGDSSSDVGNCSESKENLAEINEEIGLLQEENALLRAIRQQQAEFDLTDSPHIENSPSDIDFKALLTRIERLEVENRTLRGEITHINRKGTLQGRVIVGALERGSVFSLSSWKSDELEWSADVKLADDGELLITVHVLGATANTTLRGSFHLDILSNGRTLIKLPNQPLTIRSPKLALTYSCPLAKFKDAMNKYICEEKDGVWVADIELNIHVPGAFIYGAAEDQVCRQQTQCPCGDRLASVDSDFCRQMAIMKRALEVQGEHMAILSAKITAHTSAIKECRNLLTTLKSASDPKKAIASPNGDVTNKILLKSNDNEVEHDVICCLSIHTKLQPKSTTHFALLSDIEPYDEVTRLIMEDKESRNREEITVEDDGIDKVPPEERHELEHANCDTDREETQPQTQRPVPLEKTLLLAQKENQFRHHIGYVPEGTVYHIGQWVGFRGGEPYKMPYGAKVRSIVYGSQDRDIPTGFTVEIMPHGGLPAETTMNPGFPTHIEIDNNEVQDICFEWNDASKLWSEEYRDTQREIFKNLGIREPAPYE